MDSSDRAIAKAQFIKAKRAETRLHYSLMADAEIRRLVPQWDIEFEKRAQEQVPEVLDLASAARRLNAGA